MAYRRSAVWSLASSVVVWLGATVVAAESPICVSPGAADRFTEIESRCPTFIWTAVPGASAYELIVYQLPDEPAAIESAGIELSPDDQVLFAELPAGATAWQPELARALSPGASHVWFVRAVLRTDGTEVVETSVWSDGRFFVVSEAPSPQEIEQALDVLRRAGGFDVAATTAIMESRRTVRPDGAARNHVPRQAVSLHGGTKSVPTAPAGIRASMSDTSGEVYGVVGGSDSPNGAGVAAVNTAGGPDLVLDGSEDLFADAELRESGIDRPSGTPQNFDISNSGGAGMTLRVDGVEVTTVDSDLDAAKLTSGVLPDARLAGTYSQTLSLSNPANVFTGSGAGLTSVDADTLDGTEGATYATDAEAAGLVAAHAASADHDDRYFTENELAISGAGGAVHWNNLGAVPPGFADGIDNEASFTAGPGIILDGGEIRIDTAAFSTQLFAVDHVGIVGSHSSIAIGADGLGLISYYDASYHGLKIAHCLDVVCSEAVLSRLDTYGYSGTSTAVTIGADGLGLVSFYEGLQNDLKVAHCSDLTCASATITPLDTVGDVGADVSITIGADGLGLISYCNATSGNLKVAHCNDVACASATTPTLDSVGDVGKFSAITIGVDGFGLISYVDETNDRLKVAHCTDIACSSADLVDLADVGTVGSNTSIAIGADGLGIISYFETDAGELRVAHCYDIACTTARISIVDTALGVGEYTSLAIGADGLGLVSYIDKITRELKLARCADTVCSSATTVVIDGEIEVDGDTSIAIGVDGLGLISYADSWDDLGIAHLGIGVP